jgi:hypothetical protein
MAQEKLTPVPIRADRDAVRHVAMRSLARAAVSVAQRELDRNSVRSYPNDRDVALILRAPTPPMSIADAVAYQTIAQAFLANLVPISASAALLARAINLTFDGAAAISFPGIVPPVAGFIAEGQPFPVAQGTTYAGVRLDPAKIGVLVALTGEMVRNTNAEALISRAVLDASGASLDRFLFDAQAAVAELRPAGLLHGIAPLTAGGGMIVDLQNLVEAVGPVAGNSQLVVIAPPRQAAAILLETMLQPFNVLMSATIPAGTVICVATNAVVACVDAPAIDASRDSVVHMEDTTPGAVVASSPTYSMFQIDAVSLKLRWPVSWVLRDPKGVAWVDNVTW